MMHIRSIVDSDTEAVTAITAATPEAAQWGPGAYRAILADPAKGCLLVAEEEGVIAGFVCFRIVGEEAEVLNLAVLPAMRRQRIGARLLQSALEQASLHGAKRIFLEVRDSNEAALQLYERYGFARVGSRPGYYANPPGDAVILSRRLRQAVQGNTQILNSKS